jgi:hypothetical protein
MRVFGYTISTFTRLETSLSLSHCVGIGARWMEVHQRYRLGTSSPNLSSMAIHNMAIHPTAVGPETLIHQIPSFPRCQRFIAAVDGLRLTPHRLSLCTTIIYSADNSHPEPTW